MLRYPLFSDELITLRFTPYSHPLLLTLALVIMAALGGCAGEQQEQVDANVLTIVTRLGPTTYYTSANGPAGFEYRLAHEFASSIGKQLEVIETHNIKDIFTFLEDGTADLAAAGLSLTPQRRERYLASEPYAESQPLVLYRYGRARPRSLSDLKGMLMGSVSHKVIQLAPCTCISVK